MYKYLPLALNKPAFAGKHMESSHDDEISDIAPLLLFSPPTSTGNLFCFYGSTQEGGSKINGLSLSINIDLFVDGGKATTRPRCLVLAVHRLCFLAESSALVSFYRANRKDSVAGELSSSSQPFPV